MRRLQKTKSLTPASLPSWHDIIKLLTLLDIIDHWSLNQESRPTTHHPQNHTSKQFHSHWPSLYLTTTAGFSRCGPSCQILDIISTLNPAVSENSMTLHLVLHLDAFWWSVNQRIKKRDREEFLKNLPQDQVRVTVTAAISMSRKSAARFCSWNTAPEPVLEINLRLKRH